MVATEAAKLRYLSGGQVTCPLTVRASVGAGLGFGLQHSQTLETWLYATPGITLAVASNPQNAYGLLRSAIQSEDPVVVLEPRVLYAHRGDVTTGEEGIVPLGKAELVESGTDVAIVTLGTMRGTTVDAVADAAWSADIIDFENLDSLGQGGCAVLGPPRPVDLRSSRRARSLAVGGLRLRPMSQATRSGI